MDKIEMLQNYINDEFENTAYLLKQSGVSFDSRYFQNSSRMDTLIDVIKKMQEIKEEYDKSCPAYIFTVTKISDREDTAYEVQFSSFHDFIKFIEQQDFPVIVNGSVLQIYDGYIE